MKTSHDLNISTEILSWEISPSERRDSVKKTILKAWLALIGLAVFSIFYYVSNFLSWTLRDGVDTAIANAVYVIIGVMLSIWLFFILNKFIPYKTRLYHLDNSGITVSKDRLKKNFSWNQFESFYPYRSYQDYTGRAGESIKKELLTAGKHIEGKIFYLKKKPTGLLSMFYKTFLVIYSEPDNEKAVLKFLNTYLSEKKMSPGTDLGLVFYHFK
jgi:hypothetical protein